MELKATNLYIIFVFACYSMCSRYSGGEIKDNSGLQFNGFIQRDHSASLTQSPSVGGNHSPTSAQYIQRHIVKLLWLELMAP